MEVAQLAVQILAPLGKQVHVSTLVRSCMGIHASHVLVVLLPILVLLAVPLTLVGLLAHVSTRVLSYLSTHSSLLVLLSWNLVGFL